MAFDGIEMGVEIYVGIDILPFHGEEDL